MEELPSSPGGPEQLGSYIRRLREEHGFSVRGLAAAAGIDGSYLSRLEHGGVASPDPRMLYQLSRALEVEVADLYLAAGYRDGRGLPGFTPYLRAKYDLPADAIAQLEAHFDLINEKYHPSEKGDAHDDLDHYHPA